MIKKHKKRLDKSNLSAADSEVQDSQQISIESVSTDMIPLSQDMFPVSDGTLLARVDNFIHSSFRFGKSVNNAVSALKITNSDVYKVIIPQGEILTKSRKMKGAFRAFYREKGKIKGNANLIKIEQSGLVVSNTIDATMNVASLIVGQYYMSQIDKKLTDIGNSVSQISNFQDNQYKSKVFALLTKIQTVSSFQLEILENNQQRSAILNTLENLERQCIELLGQANLTIVDFTNKTEIDYLDYEKELTDSYNWFVYQKELLDTLYRIADLKFTLYLGEMSREHCNALLSVYTKQCEEASLKLASWHKSTVKRLNIDMSDMRRRRDGFDGIIHRVAGIFDDSYNFKSILPDTARKIDAQMSQRRRLIPSQGNLYRENVELLIKDGIVYYLLDKKSNTD